MQADKGPIRKNRRKFVVNAGMDVASKARQARSIGGLARCNPLGVTTYVPRGLVGRLNEKKALGSTKCFFRNFLAERTGLEPATPGVTGRYSNQLNYRSAAVYY